MRRCGWARPKILVVVMLALAVPVLVGSAQAVQAPGDDLLPNLQVLPATDVQIRKDLAGVRQLWFATTVVDSETAPFELNPRAEDCNGNGDVDDDRGAYQRLYRDANGDGIFQRGIDTAYRDVKVGCTYFHVEHNHWHFENYARYDLVAYTTGGSLGAVVASSQKVSFCIADEMQVAPEVPGSPHVGYYSQLDTGCTQDSTQGTSAGWGDQYGTNRDGQFISLAGLRDGTYCLSMTANPSGNVQETSTSDNTTRSKVTISGTTVKYMPYEPCTAAEGAAPDTTITDGPPASGGGSSATFSFRASTGGYRFECKVDDGAWATCGAPKTVAGLASGQHTFSARAFDVFGRVDASPASRTWSVVSSSGPANDAFANAQAFDRAAGAVAADTTYATVEPGEPQIAWNAGGHSVWYSWTPATAGTATIDTVGSSFDTTLAVYTGSTLATLQKVAEDDDSAGGRLSRVTFDAAAGTTYRIQADGYNGSSGGVWFGALKLNWNGPGAGAPPPAPAGPANDAFAGASALSGATGSATGDTSTATLETGEPQIVANRGGHSVWFAWTAPTAGPATFDTVGSAFDTTLAVYTGGSLGALAKVAEDDDSAGDRLSRVSFTAAAGTTYRIQLDGYDGTSGPAWFGAYTLRWTGAGTPPPSGGPANDHFADAAALDGTATGDTTTATRENGEPQIVGNSGGRSLWYAWTAPADGPATLDTIGSAFDTTLAVYTGGSLGALTKVAEDDDSAGNRLSRLTFTATAGTTYRIQVDGYRGTSGPAWFGALSVTVNRQAAAPPPPPPPPPPSGGPSNDHFAGAHPLGGRTGSVSGDTTTATVEAGEPQIVGNAGGHSVWFALTPAVSGTVTLDTIGSAFDTTVAVYTGGSLAALQKVAEDDDMGGDRTSRLSFAATAGVTYHVQVDGYNGTSGPAWFGAFTLSWS